MKKIIRLTENDLTHLIKRVIQEQSTRPFTISSVRDTNDDKARSKTYTVKAVNGNVTINGNKIKNKSMIKPSDKITMNQGDTIIFEDMPGYGQVTLSFKNNKPNLNLSSD